MDVPIGIPTNNYIRVYSTDLISGYSHSIKLGWGECLMWFLFLFPWCPVTLNIFYLTVGLLIQFWCKFTLWRGLHELALNWQSPSISPNAHPALSSQRWTGNVQEKHSYTHLPHSKQPQCTTCWATRRAGYKNLTTSLQGLWKQITEQSAWSYYWPGGTPINGTDPLDSCWQEGGAQGSPGLVHQWGR